MIRAKLKSVHPVLPSQDISASIRFYVDRLGFKLCGQDSTSEPKYAVVARDNVELHIQWHDPAEWSAAERPMLRIVTNSIKKLFDEYGKAEVFHDGTAIRYTPWGTREFAFFDPYNNGLTFYCDI